MLRLLAVLAFVLAACGAGATSETTTDPANSSTDPGNSESATTTSASSSSTEAPTDDSSPIELPAEIANAVGSWNTDFDQRSIDLQELRLGIPALDPRDLIRPIDDPQFEGTSTSTWLSDVEPGVAIEMSGEARFYPLSILTRHEIVNGEIGGMPIVVTYCPLCNTALVFDPVVAGEVLRFGVSGLLRNSDLVMWDDTTESLWQQITGEAIVGELTGTQLEILPSRILSFGDFAESAPDGMVMTEDQGFGIPYGANPYAGYSSAGGPISSFVTAELDDSRPLMSRVVGITSGDDHVAVPFPALERQRAINVTVGGDPVVVLWGSADTADALDAAVIANSDGIGTGAAYRPVGPDGESLTFEGRDDTIVDAQTESTWNVLGVAVDGPLEGTRLEVVPHRNEFWFAWSAFFPDGRVVDD